MNIIASIFKSKCPKCRKGDLFTKPFDIKKPLDMPRNCEVCGQRTEPEPGFYFGAMFLSYIISGFALLFVALPLVFVFDWSVNATMVAVLFVAAVFYIKLLRLSRSLWIHISVKYDPEAANQTASA